MMEDVREQLRMMRQEIDDLVRCVTRLIKVLEEDDRLRDRSQQLAEEERDSRHAYVIGQFSDIQAKLAAHRPISRDDILTALRQAIDEVRQGLALRAMGASPWPPSVPPSTPSEPIENTTSDPSIQFVVAKSGRATLSFPKLTWGGAFTALKWAIAVGATGTSIALIARLAWKAIIGD